MRNILINFHYNDFKVGAYIRLSKEDENTTESESVANQRLLIKDYLKIHELKLAKEYIDDGYTGTTFNRPAFMQLIADIEAGKINMVITKDLSRLGRNYVKSGYYIEEYFPNKKIRYVSILDNVDTFQNSQNNDIAPFKALFNDMVSKDTSQKIKSILQAKKADGLYLGAKAPYGYQKDPKDKHKLIPDMQTAKIVKKIYTYFLNGQSINTIAAMLNQKGYPTPSKLKNKKDTLWSYTSVYNILKNEIYTGKTIQNVWTNISYKNKTRIKRQKQEWIINPHAHKPIISMATFKQVQIKLHKKESTPLKPRAKLLLEGFVYCHECHHLLGANYNKKSNTWNLTCNNYKKNSQQKKCTAHYTNYQKLEALVLKQLNSLAKFDNLQCNYQKELAFLNNKLNILYEDRLNGIITLTKYQELKNKIESQMVTLKTTNKINLNRDLIARLIDKITIDNYKNLRIYYKFRKNH